MFWQQSKGEMLLLQDWPPLPEFIQTKNAPRSSSGSLQGRASVGGTLDLPESTAEAGCGLGGRGGAEIGGVSAE
jgi:hypothetical protein